MEIDKVIAYRNIGRLDQARDLLIAALRDCRDLMPVRRYNSLVCETLENVRAAATGDDFWDESD